ncbi:hypothetical protein FWH13_03225 [Candidatus Saccharibacteria bacterium]|nr:hypothetical protein [Candidatus Saccharibacteria bacterium]
MKILKLKDESTGGVMTAAILREIERLVCQYEYLVPRGWRAIVACIDDDEGQNYTLDVQGNKGGGSFAEAKMNTLCMIPNLTASGEITIAQLKEAAQSISLERGEAFDYDFPEDTTLITRKIAEEIRDKFGLTAFHGGIEIGFEDLVIGGSNHNTRKGKIRIAFSGASAEQDIFFALMIFQAIRVKYAAMFENIQSWYNLRGLEAAPAARLWMDIFGIKEA